jgi:hypothetical protein
MSSLRLALVLIGTAAIATVAASPVAGKDGVKATLTTQVPLRATPGTQITIAWKLASKSGRPFGAGEVFVRLLSATHARAEITVLSCSGSCKAKVRVPKGGIADIQVGIRDSGGGLMMFPITNDPVRPGQA